MAFAETAWHVFGATFVFFIGVLVAIKIAKKFGISGKRSLLLYVWHSIFCCAYAIYVVEVGGDAVSYYEASLLPLEEFSFGTEGVNILTSIFTQLFGLSLIGVFFVFNIFGFIGLLAFDASLKGSLFLEETKLRRLSSLIVFLPSVSFWSSAIGKDALSFMATGLILWSALDFKSRNKSIIFSVIVMLFVRPHIAALIVFSLAVAIVFQRSIGAGTRLLIGLLAGIASIAIIPFALNYAGVVSEDGTEGLNSYINQRQGYNQEGGGALDISEMSIPMQMFSYLFRPLPFEAHSIFSLAASFDNIILLYLFLSAAWSLFVAKVKFVQSKDRSKLFLWILSVSMWVVLATTTANLGISVRQKWMFVPILSWLLIDILSRRSRAQSMKIIY